MPSTLQIILAYTLIPVIGTIVAGVLATFRPPSPQIRSAIQHFAAGVVFAALAGELLPEIIAAHLHLPIIAGFSLGVLLMLGIKILLNRQDAAKESRSEETATAAPTTLLTTVGLDMFIDGLLIGVGFAAGAEVGVLLTVALSIELVFLGLSVAATLTAVGTKRGTTIAAVTGVALLVLLGALVGGTLLASLAGALRVAVLSFGAAALLYLVTEELLTEAHEVKETPFTTAMFFLGFLVLLLIEVAA